MSLSRLIFIVPGAYQGQTIETSFAEERGRRSWRKVVDQSVPVSDPSRVTYSRQVSGEWRPATAAEVSAITGR